MISALMWRRDQMKRARLRFRHIGTGVAASLLILGSMWACRKSSESESGQTVKEESVVEPGEFLDEYTGQTTEELIQLASEYRMDSIVLAFEQALDQKAARAGIEALSEEEKIILAVEALEREVNNGGYGQFFINSSNEYASIIVDALKRIRCPRTAGITKAAIAALSIDGEPTVDAIEKAMREENARRDEKLNELDGEYFESREDIAGNLFAFIKSNRNRIVLE